MKAIILSAGRGSRMGELTDDRPKCLVRIDGRPLFDRQTSALRGGGAGEIGVVTGWRHEAFAGIDARLFHNPRWADTTMVESLAAAGEWLEREPVLVAYGDIVFSAAAVRRLAAATADLAVTFDPHWRTLWTRRFERPLDDAETFRLDDAGNLADIGGRPKDMAEVQGQYMGLLKFTPASWAGVCRARAQSPDIAGRDMTGLLRHLVRECRMTVSAVPSPEPWCEFDHPSDLPVGREVLRLLDKELGKEPDEDPGEATAEGPADAPAGEEGTGGGVAGDTGPRSGR